LPKKGPGHYIYGQRCAQWGQDITISTIMDVAEEWSRLHPDRPIGVGNISLERGGHYGPHKGHKTGLDVDILPMRKDDKQINVIWNSPEYDRELTQEMVYCFLKRFHVIKIYFNDPRIRGASPYKGHDNHLHIKMQ
jgi:murein endopeptidase